MERKLFCELGPAAYKISRIKGILLRYTRDFLSREKIAKTRVNEELPNIVKSHSSILLRKLYGVDMTLQENKATNIQLACQKVNGIIVRPGETFSYWNTIGYASKRKGYKEGLVVGKKRIGKSAEKAMQKARIMLLCKGN